MVTTFQAIETDPRWQAFMARDADADGRFVTAVLSTGIYCRPSCPARRPKPENVRFYASGAEAVRAGFRSCLRCRPDEPAQAAVHQGLVAEACRRLATSNDGPSLDVLAQAAGLSPFYFHRVFKSVTGVTPKAYAAAQRAARLRSALGDPATSVTAAAYEAGFGSNSRFYAATPEALGMTPTAYRSGGAGTALRFATAACALGTVLVAASPKGICAILLGDDPGALVEDLRKRFPKAEVVGDDAAFAATVARVVALIEAPSVGLDLPLDIAGTAFQRRVWDALRAIPAGETATYKQVAERIGQPKAVRAVAGACAANPIAVAVPCHRVVHGSGSASGYRWGVERKRRLLAQEGADRNNGAAEV